MPRVKVCGITREADLAVAIEAGADAVGFIVGVSVETPRELAPERAAELVERVPPFVTAVLVTMPDSVETAAELHERVGTDAVQVHGGFDPDDLAALRERIDRPLLRAVDATDPDVRAHAGAADALLLDSTDEQGGGGTGETADWDRACEVVESVETPVVLAGGLTPGNVADAIRAVGPYGVDVATGVEAEGGRKDHDAVRRFVARATGREVVET